MEVGDGAVRRTTLYIHSSDFGRRLGKLPGGRIRIRKPRHGVL